MPLGNPFPQAENNAPIAKPGPYVTPLAPQQEQNFQSWVQQNKIPWQDTPNADYDMRGFWKAQQAGDPNATRAANLHFPDTYKTPFHRTFSNESQYATSEAPHWQGDDAAGWRLIDRTGKVVTAEGMPGMPSPPRATPQSMSVLESLGLGGHQ